MPIPPPVSTASPSSTPSSSPLPSPTLSLSRLAFVSQIDLQAALDRERVAAKELCSSTGTVASGGRKEQEDERAREGKREWTGAVGPRSGRKIGNLLRRKSNSESRTEAFSSLERVAARDPATKEARSAGKGASSTGFKVVAALLGRRRD
ncbi:hypothetical protein JCM8097_008920 [Rhodosporidiobolus ruineniae]